MSDNINRPTPDNDTPPVFDIDIWANYDDSTPDVIEVESPDPHDGYEWRPVAYITPDQAEKFAQELLDLAKVSRAAMRELDKQ